MKAITYDPETHVLVPREPSEEMLEKLSGLNLEVEKFFTLVAARYKAMIAAAPQPELAEGSVVAFVLTDKNINHLQVNSVEALVARAKHAHMTDIKLRINGKDEWYEADWIKHLKLSQSQPEPVDVEPDCYVGRIEDGAMLLMSMPDDWVATPLYTTPQPDRTAELEAALKVAKDTIEAQQNGLKWYQDAYPDSISEADYEEATKVEEALAKINEVLNG